ncbi:MAG TPA: hypothetical protein VIO86_01085 [Candidatus Dormibacteraeota bacterium]|jgi:hypothetical protein
MPVGFGLTGDVKSSPPGWTVSPQLECAKRAYVGCLSLRSQIAVTSVRVERRMKLDVCPFVRPFPTGFDACPEFRPIAFVATDLSHRPLGEQVTCQNLKVGGNLTRGYYPRCDVGWPARRQGEASLSR